MEFTDSEKEILKKMVTTRYNYLANQKSISRLNLISSPENEKFKRQFKFFEDRCAEIHVLLKKIVNL